MKKAVKCVFALIVGLLVFVFLPQLIAWLWEFCRAMMPRYMQADNVLSWTWLVGFGLSAYVGSEAVQTISGSNKFTSVIDFALAVIQIAEIVIIYLIGGKYAHTLGALLGSVVYVICGIRLIKQK